MKSVGLVQIFCPVKETNRTHSQSYVEDLSTQTGRKRCAKTAVLNLSVLPQGRDRGLQPSRRQSAKIVTKALLRVSQNPLPANEGGYGKALGNHTANKLSGLLKIKLKESLIK